MRNNRFKAVVLLLLALPLIAAPCVEEKVVDVTLGMPTTVLLLATGSQNITFTSGNIDVQADLDVLGALDEADIDIQDIDKNATKVTQVFYRVARPDAEATRMVNNANLAAGRVDASNNMIIGGPGGSVFISNWSGAFGTGAVDPNEWIDITNLLNTSGLDLLNTYMFDLICALQAGTTMQNPEIRYIYNGVSSPQNVATDFEYEIKVVFTTTVMKTFDVPFG